MGYIRRVGTWRREMKPNQWQGERGGGNRNEEKGYKKEITILLFTRAMLGTPASKQFKAKQFFKIPTVVKPQFTLPRSHEPPSVKRQITMCCTVMFCVLCCCTDKLFSCAE